MESQKHISQEEINLEKAVANLPKGNPFSVPNGYFDQFPIEILELLSIEPVLTVDAGKNNPFEVSSEYFEEFTLKIIEKIKQIENPDAELDHLSGSLLKDLKNQNPFTVPEGYFNNFETRIPAKNSNLQPVFSIKRILQYAAAACIIGLMFFGYIGMNNKKGLEASHMVATTQNTNELPLESISSYLKESELVSPTPETEEFASKETNLLVDINKETVSMVLTEVSENDIKQYLDQSGETLTNSLN